MSDDTVDAFRWVFPGGLPFAQHRAMSGWVLSGLCLVWLTAVEPQVASMPSPASVGCYEDEIDEEEPSPTGWIQTEEQPPGVVSFDAAFVLPVTSVGLDLGDDHQSPLGYLEVMVLAEDGSAVAGRIESKNDRGSVLLWRPNHPLESGTSLAVMVRADNAALAANEQLQGEPAADWERSWSMDVSDTPVGVVGPDDIAIELRHVVVEQLFAPRFLVCCDGAYPELSGHGSSLCYEGTCGSRWAVGEIHASVTIPSDVDPALANNTHVARRRVVVDGDETCVEVSIANHSTGESMISQRCSETPAGTIGMIEDYDPGPRLRDRCQGELYTCEEYRESDQGSSWNPDACSPWQGPLAAAADDGPSEGCSCSGANRDAAPSWGLVLLGLGLVRVRRRLRRS